MLGYKGFDNNFQCRGFQYEVGQTYHHDGEIKVCGRGFHFCTKPSAVFEFYPPTNSRFAVVEATGNIDSDKLEPSKKCTDEITIVKELSLDELIAHDSNSLVDLQDNHNSVAISDFLFSTACTLSSECVAINRGSSAIAVAGGRYSAAYVTGNNSIAVATGKSSKAKGAIGCWLVLAEWDDWDIADVQVFFVDGKIIKPDTFYTLKDGKPVEVSPYD